MVSVPLPRRWNHKAKHWEMSPRQMGNCLILLLLLGVFIGDYSHRWLGNGGGRGTSYFLGDSF